jgi:Lipocalin-like domain
MSHRIATVLGATVLICSGVAFPGAAVAQTAKDLAGTWMITSSVNVRPDGTRAETLNKGMLVFDNNGRFILLALRPGLPKFASNNRNTGTPEENKAIVQGSVALYGTYTAANKEVTLKVEASTFPGFDGTEQKRTNVVLTGDELKWIIPESSGSTGARTEQAFKRAK